MHLQWLQAWEQAWLISVDDRRAVMVVQTIGAFLAVISFSLILELPKKHVVLAGGIGAAAGLSIFWCKPHPVLL